MAQHQLPDFIWFFKVFTKLALYMQVLKKLLRDTRIIVKELGESMSSFSMW